MWFLTENIDNESKKLSLIFYEVSRFDLSRVDSLALFFNLYNSLFTEEEKENIKTEVTTTDFEWSVNIKIGNDYIYYNFDTKKIDYNIKNNKHTQWKIILDNSSIY